MSGDMLSPWFVGLAIVVALAAGITGSFALMKGITLGGDVISHIALPGIGLALLLRFHPLIGGAATLLAGTLLIARLEACSGLATETAIGVVFVASLALGALLTPGKDLEEALFGNFSAVSASEFAAGFIAAVLVIAVLWSKRHQLILHLFSPELAVSLGVNGHTSACSMVGGIALAAWRELPLGPPVVAVASLLFVCSLTVAER
jgi:ABC-type Mn2+/Zn2+ transport system permease subunit